MIHDPGPLCMLAASTQKALSTASRLLPKLFHYHLTTRLSIRDDVCSRSQSAYVVAGRCERVDATAVEGVNVVNVSTLTEERNAVLHTADACATARNSLDAKSFYSIILSSMPFPLEYILVNWSINSFNVLLLFIR